MRHRYAKPQHMLRTLALGMLVATVACLSCVFPAPFCALAQSSGQPSSDQASSGQPSPGGPSPDQPSPGEPSSGQLSPGEPPPDASPSALTGPFVRIKDISRVLGVRSNQLMGYGLVIGLNGTGDSRQAIFTTQAVSNMLEHFGISVDSQDIRLRNVAGVMVTCDLPAFVKNGDRVDVVVSSLGDARSLEGGMLLLTQLQGPDGKTYAVAQGPVSIGGRSGSGMRSQSNFPTVARIPEGAIIEREVPTTFADVGSGTVAVTLNQPDFTTASRVAAAINARLGEGVASAVDGATVRVKIPPGYSQDAVGLVAAIEELMVKADTVARVAINERTGTVVIGGNVCLLPAAVAHGNLRVQVGGGSGSPGAFSAAEPAPASGGGPAPARPMTLGGPGAAAGITAGGSNAAVSVTPSGPGAAISIIPGGTVDVLVAALNAIGASPRDIIAILQALKSAGSLLAEVEIL